MCGRYCSLCGIALLAKCQLSPFSYPFVLSRTEITVALPRTCFSAPFSLVDVGTRKVGPLAPASVPLSLIIGLIDLLCLIVAEHRLAPSTVTDRFFLIKFSLFSETLLRYSYIRKACVLSPYGALSYSPSQSAWRLFSGLLTSYGEHILFSVRVSSLFFVFSRLLQV